MKHILLTHYDLDGAACEIAFRMVFGDKVLAVSHGNHHEIDRRFVAILDNPSLNPYNVEIWFADISPDRLILERAIQEGYTVHLYDHHESAGWVKQVLPNSHFNPAMVECGASLLFKDIVKQNPPPMVAPIERFIEKVRSWDTWDWWNKNDQMAKRLVTLFFILGYEYFVHFYLHRFQTMEKDDGFIIIPAHDLFIDSRIHNQQEVIESITPEKVITRNICGYRGAVLFTGIGFSFSDGSSQFLRRFPEYDVMININLGMKTISYRTMKNNVDLSMIAKKMGGGGHKKSAGSPVPFEVMDTITDAILMKILGG